MKKIFISTFLLIVSLHQVSSQAVENEHLFTTWIESKIKYENWPGAVVGVVKDNELVWSRAYGLADREKGIKMETSLYFSIASANLNSSCSNHKSLFLSLLLIAYR